MMMPGSRTIVVGVMSSDPIPSADRGSCTADEQQYTRAVPSCLCWVEDGWTSSSCVRHQCMQTAAIEDVYGRQTTRATTPGVADN